MFSKLKDLFNRNIKVSLAVLVLIIVFGIVVGKNVVLNRDLSQMMKNQEQDKKITRVTSGLIKAGDKIAIRFDKPQVYKRYVGETIKNKGIFTFIPELKGEVYWSDEQTVVFKPEEKLVKNQDYTGFIHLDKLFLSLEEVSPVKKGIEFKTLGQYLESLDGEFELIDNSNQGKARFVARLKLAEKEDKDVVKEAIGFTGSKGVDLEVKTADNYNFTLVSDLLTQTEEDQNFSLVIKKEKLGLHKDFKQNYLLPAIGPLRILNIEEEKVDDHSNIRMIFSDDLAKDLNYEAYLNVEPELDYEVNVDGRVLTLAGEFKADQKYRIKVFKGIKGRLGSKLATTKNVDFTVKISDIEPRLRFAQSGMFLTTAKKQKITFQTMNVRRVTAKLKKVSSHNLIEFIERHSYRPNSDSYDEYDERSFQWAGEVIEVKSLKIGEEKNKWITSQLDLSSAIEESQPGLYIVQLEFDEDDTLYMPKDWDDYDAESYVRSNGRKTKHIILSNLGVTVKKTSNRTYVFVTDLLTARPVENAIVKLKDEYDGTGDYNDRSDDDDGDYGDDDGDNYDDYDHDAELIEVATTDENGICVLNKEAEYLVVEKGRHFSILEFDETKLDSSLFNTGGINNEAGIKAFMYTDRGVYRPGDKINLSVIVRNEDNTFPSNHPVTLKVYNPKRKLVYEETSRKAEDGFYTFGFATKKTDLTGNWEMKAEIAGQSFYKELKVESVVPYRIEVKIEPEKEKLKLSDSKVNFSLSSKYLFGAPAQGLDSKTIIKIEPYEVSFDRFKHFTFTNSGQYFSPISSEKFNKELNKEGRTDISWKLPEIHDVPSALRVNINSKVLEKGGRPVPATKWIPIEVYDRYVGIRELEDSDLEIGNKVNFDIALVSKDGELIAGEKLKYKIYRMRRYWWWEYDDRDSFRKHFKNDSYTEVIAQGTLTSKENLASLEYELDDYGELFLEVEDVNGGHKAGYFFRSYWWGDSGTKQSADIVTLKSDKEEYYPGEIAKIALDTPKEGRILFAIEKNGQLLDKRWEEIEGNQTILEIPIKKEYIPNAYVFISVYQPQDNGNDLPIRIYGIKSLKVNKKDADLNYILKTPEEIRPKEGFKIEVQTKDKRVSQFTIAVVDEGLLDITNFRTPDPLAYFFQKERLITKTFDTFSDIIGLDCGYIYNVFSIGGGVSKKYQEKQLQAEQTDRFEPVALFKGPVKTDQSGHAEVDFKMPNYIGSVRVMVIGANKGNYGQVEKNIPVKTELMLMPTLPRVLGPGDKIKVPVTVFGMADNLTDVQVRMKVEGPVEIIGDQVKQLHFNGVANKDIEFDLKAKDGVGEAKIEFTAVDKKHNYHSEKAINLAVRPYNPYTYKASKQVIKAGKEVSFKVPNKGIENTNYAQVSLSKRRSLNLNHRLKWLIRYPYGCIEQTTSSVFPQLYLTEVLPMEEERLKEIDQNINAAIKRFRKFQLANGGFSYWPNGNHASLWGTNYAGHFLIEAQTHGYSVPGSMLADWLEYQREQSKDKEGGRLTRAYRLYLLTLANKPLISEMNYMRENELEQMNDTSKFFLAGAYKIAGYDKVADKLIADLDFEVEDYQETAGTYGSSLRDKAVILDIMTCFKKYDTGLVLYNDIAKELSSEDWYSTQTTAYSLLATSKYLIALDDQDKSLEAEVILATGVSKKVNTDEKIANLPVTDSYGKQVKVRNNMEIPLFAILEWEGIPLRGEIEPSEKNLSLQVEWLDEEGNKIDPSKLKQGTTFWGHFIVDKTVEEEINEMALVQILPAGWEIENIRLSDSGLPEWMDDYDLDNEEYMDIRDDRIRWFFDMGDYDYDYEFVVKINTVTVGEFYLPPTVVEAMYNNKYKANTAGRRVKVLSRGSN